MENQLIHKHHHNPFKAWHLAAIFFPSVLFFAAIFFFSGKSEVKTSAAFVEVPTPEPRIVVSLGEDIKINAEKADTEIKRRIGLANHTYLGEFDGMLFYMPENTQPPFWMKNMKIAIDIIWINDGKITQISENAQPEPGKRDQELSLYIPNDPIDYVLEVNAGFAQSHDVKVGDSVQISVF